MRWMCCVVEKEQDNQQIMLVLLGLLVLPMTGKSQNGLKLGFPWTIVQGKDVSYGAFI